MWPRVVEVMLACWMAMSPFVFGHPARATSLWAHDFLCAAAVAVFALLSFWKRTPRAHLLVAAVGTWLAVFGWISASDPPSAATQNHIVTGLLLLMLGIIPEDEGTPLASRTRGPD
jgi:hypothetical protein